MARAFAAAPLTADDVNPAFALVRAWYPSVSLATWRDFARTLAGETSAPQSSIIGVRNEAGYLSGLFVYRVEVDLERGRVLVIDPVAALDFINVGVVAQAMIDAAQAITLRLGCSATCFRIPDEQAWFAGHLKKSGHRIEAQVLSLSSALPSQLV
jgi:hypothetical protein